MYDLFNDTVSTKCHVMLTAGLNIDLERMWQDIVVECLRKCDEPKAE
jgi:hypothetical protein